MTTEIQNDFIKSHHKYGVWKKICQSLVIDGNAIWEVRNDIIQIRDEYLSLNNETKKKFKECMYLENKPL
jgi:hypothetical protein